MEICVVRRLHFLYFAQKLKPFTVIFEQFTLFAIYIWIYAVNLKYIVSQMYIDFCVCANEA